MNGEIRYLSLFSGAGGGDLACQHLLGWRCVGYVEWETYCQKILAARIKEGYLSRAPIFGDIRRFNSDWAERYRGVADIITGGFPCQPFSVAGKRGGADDERNMWPATIEAVRLVRPGHCLLENVPGLIASGYLGTILGDLAASGYDARWRILSAAEVGAPHKRDRLWILAHTQQCGDQRQIISEENIGQDTPGPSSGPCGSSEPLAESATTQCAPGAEVERTLREVPENRGEPNNPHGSGQTLSDADQGGCERSRADSGESDARADRRNNIGGRGKAPNTNKLHEDRGGHGTSPVCRQRSAPANISGSGWWDIDPADLPDAECLRCLGRGFERVGIHRQDRPCGEAGAEDCPYRWIQGLPDTASGGCNPGPGLCEEEQTEHGRECVAGDCAWPVESGLGRVAYGVACRVDRLKAIGNGQVPAVAAAAWRLLNGF